MLRTLGTTTYARPSGASDGRIRLSTACGSRTCSSTWERIADRKRASGSGADSIGVASTSIPLARAAAAAAAFGSIPSTSRPRRRRIESTSPVLQPTSSTGDSKRWSAIGTLPFTRCQTRAARLDPGSCGGPSSA